MQKNRGSWKTFNDHIGIGSHQKAFIRLIGKCLFFNAVGDDPSFYPHALFLCFGFEEGFFTQKSKALAEFITLLCLWGIVYKNYCLYIY